MLMGCTWVITECPWIIWGCPWLWSGISPWVMIGNVPGLWSGYIPLGYDKGMSLGYVWYGDVSWIIRVCLPRLRMGSLSVVLTTIPMCAITNFMLGEKMPIFTTSCGKLCVRKPGFIMHLLSACCFMSAVLPVCRFVICLSFCDLSAVLLSVCCFVICLLFWSGCCFVICLLFLWRVGRSYRPVFYGPFFYETGFCYWCGERAKKGRAPWLMKIRDIDNNKRVDAKPIR